MKKTLLALTIALCLTIFPVTSSQAAQTGGSSADSGILVENSLEIDEASLLIQIVDAEGIAWAWPVAGPDPGNRALPYILEGEKLHFEIEVSVADSEVDFDSMIVKMALSPSLAFNASVKSTDIDPVNNISKGLFSGDLTVDSGVATGKYDLTIDVADSAGGADTFDPQIYEPQCDILKPALTLEVSRPSVFFPTSQPGDQDVVANENPVILKPQAVIDTEHVPVVFSLSHSGTDLSNGESVLPVSSISWSATDQPAGTTLNTTAQTIAAGVSEGSTITVYYWIDVPGSQAAGDYKGKINYQFIAD